MSYIFPDAERAVMELLEQLEIGTITAWLEYGFEGDVSEENCVVLVEAGQGNQASVFRSDPITITVYGQGRSATMRVANQICSTLTSGPHGTTEGLLDKIDVQSLPGLVHYPHDRVNMAVAVYEVDTRPR